MLSSSSSPSRYGFLTEPLTRSAPLPPLDLSHHFSETTRRRLPSSMKAYYKYFMIPGIGNLAGGLPNAQFFPFNTLEAQSAQPARWKPTPNHPEPEWESDFDSPVPSSHSQPKSPVANATCRPEEELQHLTVPMLSGERDPSHRVDITTALQYGTAQGYPALLSWIRQFTRNHLHPSVPYKGGPEVILTCGSTDGFAKTIELLVDSWLPAAQSEAEREGLLCEKFAYPNALNQAQPKGVIPVPVEIDEMGMLASGPGGLENILTNWDSSKGKRPRLMYTVTIGHNPTSAVLSVERRKEIYAICERYDVIIIEDEPYWYLQYPSAEAEEAKSRNQPIPTSAQDNIRDKGAGGSNTSSGFEFLDSLVQSYLSMDVSGRVIRLDTFSKTVAPGCRLGWITAQPAFIDRLLRITESTTQQPSGFVQSMVASLILGPQPPSAATAFAALSEEEKPSFEGWDISGWVRWLAGLRGQYERRMARMCAILDAGSILIKQSTPNSLADRDYGVISTSRLLSFRWSRGGMFVWLRIHFESHPLFNASRPLLIHHSREGVGCSSVHRRRILDGIALSTALMLFCTQKPHLVLVSPGLMFAANDGVRVEEGWKYYRICFAAESEENVSACSHRFVSALHRFWKIKNVEEIEDLLREFEGTDFHELQRGVLSLTESMGNMGWIGC